MRKTVKDVLGRDMGVGDYFLDGYGGWSLRLGFITKNVNGALYYGRVGPDKDLYSDGFGDTMVEVLWALKITKEEAQAYVKHMNVKTPIEFGLGDMK
jgi:hypothetical protein